MTQKEVIVMVATRTGYSQAQIKETIKEIIGVIEEQWREGESVRFQKFGTFRPVTSETRQGRNPQNGKSMTIPGRKTLRFKASKRFVQLNG